MNPASLPPEISLTHPLSSNHRYRTFAGLYEQKPAFIKVAKDNTILYRLRSEVSGLKHFQDIAALLGKEYFTLPRLYATGTNYVVYSLEPGKITGAADPLFSSRLKKLVKIYALIDKAMFQPQTSENLLVRPHPVHTTKTHLEHMVEKYREIDVSEFFEPALLDRIVEYLHAEAPRISGHFAHGDLTTHNTLWQRDKPPVIIDFESCSLFWPQYYELINCVFNNYILRPNFMSATEASDLIELYRVSSGISDTQQFIRTSNFTVALRGLGIIIETLGGTTEEHATKESMDHETAKRLTNSLESVLAHRAFV